MQDNAKAPKLPLSGSGYTWKYSKKKIAASSERHSNTSAPDHLNLDSEASYRKLSPHLKQVDTRQSPLDKQFFMRKIQQGKRLN